VKIDALLDTGACISVMCTKVFDQIPMECKRKVRNDVTNARAVDGNQLHLLGKYEFSFKIRDKEYSHPFCVMNTKESNTILGIDFIKIHNVKVEGGKITLNGVTDVFELESIIPETTRLLKRKESLPPMSMTGIKVVTPFAQRTIYIQEKSNDSIGTLNYLSTTDEDGVAIVPIINKERDFVTLKRDELDNFFEISEVISDKFDVALINAVTVSSDATDTEKEAEKRKRAFTSADIMKFKNKANIKCPGAFKSAYEQLLLDYIDIFAHSDYDLGFTDKVSHKITLKTDKPIYRKQFKIPLAHQEVIENYVKDMLQANIIEVARSRYNSPIFCVTKKNGKLRPVVDLRAINKETLLDAYEIRDVRACLNAITTNNSRVFSTMDLASGFFQQHLEESSRPYTAFTVPGLGQFQFKVSCFGSHGAPSSFSTLMTNCLRGLKDVLSYIDDILAHTKTHKDMLTTLESIFKRLREYNLRLSLSKSTFGAQETEYLGFKISDKGIAPGPDKLDVVRHAKPPENVRQVRQFLGLASFFRDHIANFAKISAPLNYLITKEAKFKKGPLPEDALKSFKEIKARLCSAPILSYIRKDVPFEVYTDAATGNKKPDEPVKNGGLGAILGQRWPEDNRLRVIAFASRQLRKHEKNYTPLMAECLAIYWAIEHFHIYLYGGPAFKVFTDHKPAEAWNKDKPMNNRTVDDLRNRLTNYTFTVIYRPGKDMGAPDYLSRVYEEETGQPINQEVKTLICAIDDTDREEDDDTYDDMASAPYEDLGCTATEMRTAQQAEKGIKDLILMKEGQLSENTKNEWTSAAQIQEFEVIDGIVYHAKEDLLRLVTPKIFVPKILELAHDKKMGGHRGYDKTCARIKRSFVWTSMKRDIRNYIKKCHQCQTTSQKTDKSLRTPLNPLPPAVKANERVHMDLLGPLKTHRASKYILVMTDAFSKFVVLDTIKEKTAQAVAKAFFTKWIATFSTPDFLITDNGREFDNNLIRILTNEFEIGHIKTTSYHPQTNSQCERFNRTLLGYLRNYVDRDTLDWEDKLKYAQISYNTQIHSSTGQCPHFLMFLEDPQLPFSILTKPTTDDAWPQTDLNRLHKIYKDVAEKLGNSVDQMRQYYDRRTARKEFKKGDLVLKLRQTYGPEENKKLLPIWTGPYVVTNVNRETKNVRMMDKPGGRESAATFDQVIHYHARAPYDYKKGFLGRSGNGKTREIGTQTDQPDLEHGPRIIDGGRIHESGPPLDPGPGPSGPGPAPIPGNEDDSGRFSQSQDTTDDPPTNNEPLPGPSGLRTPPDLETGPEADPTTTETSEDDDNYSVASDSLSLTSQDPTDAERPTTTSPEAETVSDDEEPRSSPSTDPEITFNLPKPRTPTSAMKKKVFYKDYQMDASFDLNPRSLAERLRTEGITGKTLIGSEVYKKESMLHAATRRITTFATGREAKPQHFCRVFYEDRGEPMETDDMDTEMDVDQTIENNDIASNAPPANTKARNKKDKISLTQKTLTRGKNLIAEKQSRKQIKDKLLETIPHKRSGMRTRSHGEADNLQLTDQLLRELRKKKKLAN